MQDTRNDVTRHAQPEQVLLRTSGVVRNIGSLSGKDSRCATRAQQVSGILRILLSSSCLSEDVNKFSEAKKYTGNYGMLR